MKNLRPSHVALALLTNLTGIFWPKLLGPGYLPPYQAGPLIARGVASFYHDGLAGERTADGHVYEPTAPTCAHRSLPFGTGLHLTVVGSTTTSFCWINDRGPYVEGRILDVSRRVAEQLGFTKKGVRRLELRQLIQPTPP